MTYASIRYAISAASLGLAMGLGVVANADAQTDSVRTLFRGGVEGASGVSGGTVALPNGKYTEYTEDISVKVAGGYVTWARDFNGNQWRFNPHWMSLNFEFDTVTLAASGSSGGGGGGGAAVMIQPQEPPEYFGGTVIPGTDGGLTGGTGPLWAISRNGAWFTAESSYCNFSVQSNSRYLLKPVFKGDAPSCPTNRFNGQPMSSGDGGGASGAISQLPGGGIPDNLAGFRWEDRLGDWIEYDRTGRMTSYGDRNNIKVTMQYAGGKMVAVLDHTGRKVLEIAYDGNRVSEVRDVPRSGDDAPARVVKYTYASNGGLKTVTDVRGNVMSYEYDDKDRMKSVTDQEGRVRTIAYGPTNRVTKLTQPDGAVTEYEYEYDSTKKLFYAKTKRPVVDGQQRVELSVYSAEGQLVSQSINGRVQRELSQDGRVDRITDGRGNVTETQRNEFNQVTSVRYADGTSITNTFDAKSLQLVEQRNRDGYLTRFERDAHGNLLREINAIGTADERITEYRRDERYRSTTVIFKGRTESDGRLTPDVVASITFDDADNIVKLVDPAGKSTVYTYNRLDQILTETDPKGGVRRYTYDAAGNLVSEQSALGHITTYGYDNIGNETSVVDARSKRYSAQYDARDRKIKSIDPYGAVYRTDYNALGAMSAVSDASGKSVSFEYDAWVRPVRSVDAKGFKYTMDYADDSGNDSGARQPTAVKYPTFERRFRYGTSDRPTQKTDLVGNEGRTENFTYDASGRIKAMSDANGKTVTYEYNAHGDIKAVFDSLGHGIKIDYDARGNISAITDPNGRRTRFEYDPRDLLLSETDPLGNTIQFEYDENGWQISRTLATGEVVKFEYDADGRLIKQHEYSAESALRKQTQFAYDESDNLIFWSDGRFQATMAYDDADRMTKKVVDYGSFKRSFAYTFYPNSQVKTYVGPDGETTSYQYDALGQLERVSLEGEGEIAVTDWEWAARKTVLLPGGSEQRFTYDGTQVLKGLRLVDPGQKTSFEFEQKHGKAQEVAATKIDGVSKNYVYDDGYRLTSVLADNAAFNEGFTVDASGNRVSQTRGGTSVGGAWEYDEGGQLKRKGAISYAYDASGRLISKVDASLAEPLRTTRFAYDAFNRLTEVTDGQGALVARYEYDPFDRRLSKELSDGSVLYYLPSINGLMAELNSAGDVLVSYGWHPEHEDGTYPLYARSKDAGGGVQYFYYHNDQLGTPLRVTNKSGVVVWAADYDAFGAAAVRTNVQEPFSNNLRFPGQYFDIETGLHYNDRRYYDPSIGRYLTRDPIGFAGGVNLYAYAAGNPINFTDPTGEIIPCLLANYLRCMASCMLLSTVQDFILECGNINWGDNLKECAIDCLWDLLPIPNPCGKLGKWLGGAVGALGALNSFPGDTLVHVRPVDVDRDAGGDMKAVLKPIAEIRPGDQVLALSEWKAGGDKADVDARLTYERVTDVLTSRRVQRLIHITLSNGETLTATEGHPFLTHEGWRDAGVLREGVRLIAKTAEEQPRDGVQVIEVRREEREVQVFNLEVANAHTFFVGQQGVLVHNGWGAYVIWYSDNTVYVGKGDESRMKTSARQHTGNSRRVVKCRHFKASSDKRSFIMEDKFIQKFGDIGNGKLLNQINSPGKKIRGR